MTTDALPPDDDDDDLSVPAPDAPDAPGERARAKGFAELIDKVVAGRTPAAVPAEEQALLEVATALRAAMRPVELAAARQSALVESALATAIDRRAGRPTGVSASLPVIPLAAAPRRRAARWAPWLVAATTSVAAAAALLLWLRERAAPPAPPLTTAVAPLPETERSRPADPLIGVIERDRAGAALDRIDAIYADRLTGYRARRMAGGRR